MNYDEQSMIEYTVTNYHFHLLTEFEKAVWYAFLARQKGKAYKNPKVEKDMRERWGNLEDSRIDSILERGYKDFSREVTDRVMREQEDQVVLNRCPICNRIVRTPTAKQCLWCYHDWH